MAGVIPAYLRTNTLFGSGSNPLGINPPTAEPDPLDEYTSKVLPLIHDEQGRQQVLNQRLMNQQRAQQQQDAGNAAWHPNVVFKDSINPLQKANLNLKQQAEQGKNDRADAALDVKKELGQSTNNIREQGVGIRQQLADVSKYKSEHPNVQFYAPKGGTVHYFDPTSQSMVDTGIDAGTITDEQKSQLGLENNLKEIMAKGDQSRQTDEQKAGENLKAIGARAAGQKDINNSKASTTKAMTPQATAADYYNKASQLINSNPDYKNYIKLDPTTKTFEITPPSHSFFGASGPDSDTYHTINQSIYGSKDDDSTSVPNVTAPESKYKVSVAP